MKINYITKVLSVVFISLILSSCFSPSGGKDLHGGDYYTVIRITDGDTFVVDDGTKKGMKVRLIGVDAPESRKTGKKEIGFFGKESKEYLEKILANTRVRLEYDVNKYDQYMRVLAYVYSEDGTFLNAKMVEEGYAQVMTVPPNVKYSELFLKLQQSARLKNKGLWSATSHKERVKF